MGCRPGSRTSRDQGREWEGDHMASPSSFHDDRALLILDLGRSPVTHCFGPSSVRQDTRISEHQLTSHKRINKQRGQAMARPAAGNCWAESILSEASGLNHLGHNPCQQTMLHDKICKKPTTRPVRGRDRLGWSVRLRNRRNLVSNTTAQRRKVWWPWATPLDRFVNIAFA